MYLTTQIVQKYKKDIEREKDPIEKRLKVRRLYEEALTAITVIADGYKDSSTLARAALEALHIVEEHEGWF